MTRARMVTHVEAAITARIVDADTAAAALAIVRQFIEDCVVEETTESERHRWLRAVLKGLNDRLAVQRAKSTPRGPKGATP
jgi:hypothetical protein